MAADMAAAKARLAVVFGVALTLALAPMRAHGQNCTWNADCGSEQYCQRPPWQCGDDCAHGEVLVNGTCMEGPSVGRADGVRCLNAGQCASEICALIGPGYNGGRCCRAGMSLGCGACGSDGTCIDCALSCKECTDGSGALVAAHSHVQCQSCKPLYTMVTGGDGVAQCVPWLSVYGAWLSIGVGLLLAVMALSVVVWRQSKTAAGLVFVESVEGAKKVLLQGVLTMGGLVLETSDVVSDGVFLSALAAEMQAGRSVYGASLAALGILWVPTFNGRLRAVVVNTTGKCLGVLLGVLLLELIGMFAILIAFLVSHPIAYDGDSIVTIVLAIMIGGTVSMCLAGYPGVMAETRRVWRAVVSALCFMRVRVCSGEGRKGRAWKVKPSAAELKREAAGKGGGWQEFLVMYEPEDGLGTTTRLVETAVESVVAHLIIALDVRRRPPSLLALASIGLSSLSFVKAFRLVLFVPRHVLVFLGGWLLIAAATAHAQSCIAVAAWLFANYDLPSETLAFSEPAHNRDAPVAPALGVYAFVRWMVVWWALILTALISSGRGMSPKAPCAARILFAVGCLMVLSFAFICHLMSELVYMFYAFVIPSVCAAGFVAASALTARFADRSDQEGTAFVKSWERMHAMFDTSRSAMLLAPWVVYVASQLVQDVWVIVSEDPLLRAGPAVFLAMADIVLMVAGAVCIGVGATLPQAVAVAPITVQRKLSASDPSTADGDSGDVEGGVEAARGGSGGGGGWSAVSSLTTSGGASAGASGGASAGARTGAPAASNTTSTVLAAAHSDASSTTTPAGSRVAPSVPAPATA